MSAFDKQVGGGHYKHFKIQPLEFIQENDLSFAQGNAIKYICRYPFKNGVQDLEKALHYIEMMIELEKKKEEVELNFGDIVPVNEEEDKAYPWQLGIKRNTLAGIDEATGLDEEWYNTREKILG